MVTNAWIVLGAGLAVCAAWLIPYRFKSGTRLENNWPLFLYLGLGILLNRQPLAFNPYALYVSVICALLLRFEFMNDRLAFLAKLVEAACLIHIIYRLALGLVKMV